MPRYKFVVMSTPAEGREQEYNDWYQNVHLRDVVAIDGIKSAQRFRLNLTVSADQPPLPYLAVYDIETNDIAGTIQELKRRSQTGQMVISDAMSTVSFAVAYEEFGPVVKA